MTHKLSSTTLQVAQVLSDCTRHTGTEIGERLGISRTAVWKVINRLKGYGIDVVSEHKGYQFLAPLLLLDKKKIQEFLGNNTTSLEVFESLSSTSDYLKTQAIHGNSPLFCFAEHQTHGRGRLGRTWASPFGRNLYFSFAFRFNKDISELSGLSLAVGVLVARGIEAVFPDVKLSLKWPNDIYLEGKKMGGVLIDLDAEAYGNCTAIVGIGLNVNMKDQQLQGLNQTWTSLEHVTNEKVNRNRLAASLIGKLVEGMDAFERHGFSSFMAAYEARNALAKQQISIKPGQEIVSGFVEGINNQGHLCVKLSSGEVENYAYGDISLLKDEA